MTFPLTLPGTKPSTVSRWGLPDEAASDIQGLVVSPFAHLPYGMAVFITLDKDCGGAGLKGLLVAGMVTDATEKAEYSGALALTYAGLKPMGLADDVLGTFSTPFREGMTDPDRERRLGDVAADPDVAHGGARHIVHALSILYGKTTGALDALVTRATTPLHDNHAAVAFTIPRTLWPGDADPATPPCEHFGFASCLMVQYD